MSLLIEHTEAEGTTLTGTTKGDGSAAVVKAHGWRWGRTLDAWYIPRSRDAVPKHAQITRTADALRTAGFVVDVDIDTTVGDRQAAEERLAERATERAERLTATAATAQRQADAHHARAEQIGARFAMGQPILVGHHSQASAERDAARVDHHTSAALEAQQRANHARDAAAVAAAATEARNNPVTVANRIQRTEAELRREERALARHGAGQSDEWRLARIGAIDRLTENLAHWQAVRARQIEDGTATNYSRETVRPGDAVKIRDTWHRVARANTKTVAVETPYTWTDKAPWHEVQDHRPATQDPAP